MAYSVDDREAFYQSLHAAIRAVPKDDKPLLIGDVNVRVGSGSQAWAGILRPHGVGKMNSNGKLFLTFFAEHDLTITNSLFQLQEIHKDHLDALPL